MAPKGAPIGGSSTAHIGLVAEVVADLTSPTFNPNDPAANASGITVPGDTDEVQRNVADDVRVAVRDALLAQGVTPPEGLTLTLRRDGAEVTYFYGKPRTKTAEKYIGPKGSTGKVAQAADTEEA